VIAIKATFVRDLRREKLTFVSQPAPTLVCNEGSRDYASGHEQRQRERLANYACDVKIMTSAPIWRSRPTEPVGTALPAAVDGWPHGDHS
jgi:hypothetical protein